MVAQALKTYGALVADNAGSPRVYISGAVDPGWNDDDLNGLKTHPGERARGGAHEPGRARILIRSMARSVWRAPCCRSTSACRRTCPGRGRPSSPASSRTRSPDLAACAGSTSTATVRAISAGHGGEQRAVFVYQIDSYRYWERELGRSDFVYGQFGENFTVEGLSDDEVCIGDRYRIGTAVFEVTQPRVTCYRVGIRMNDPRIPALLVSHRRPGFYFRVLEEGEVQAGDEIVKLASGPEQMTVAEVDALLYLPGHPRQQLLRALRIPALSPGWQASFRALLDGRARQRQRRPGGRQPASGLARLPPADRRRDRARERLGDLHPPRGPRRRAAPGRPPRPVPHAARPARRDAAVGAPQLLPLRTARCRLLPDHRQARTRRRRQRLSAHPPRASATSSRSQHRAARSSSTGRDAPVLLISAGIGATPVLAMLHALAEEHSEREIWWLHGARSGRDHSFAAEARALLASLPNVRAHVCYSRPGPDDLEGRDFDSAGRLTASLLAELEPPRDAEAYLCGPAPFMDEISAGLAAIGLDASRIHTEPFGPAPGLTPGIAADARADAPPARRRAGRRPDDRVRAQRPRRSPGATTTPSLLELAEACDVPVRWSCRTGVCHSCETTAHRRHRRLRPRPGRAARRRQRAHLLLAPQGDLVLDL